MTNEMKNGRGATRRRRTEVNNKRRPISIRESKKSKGKPPQRRKRGRTREEKKEAPPLSSLLPKLYRLWDQTKSKTSSSRKWINSPLHSPLVGKIVAKLENALANLPGRRKRIVNWSLSYAPAFPQRRLLSCFRAKKKNKFALCRPRDSCEKKKIQSRCSQQPVRAISKENTKFNDSIKTVPSVCVRLSIETFTSLHVTSSCA